MYKRELKKTTKQEEFKTLLEIPQHFNSAKVYLVGGIVRDVLSSRESDDYDFVVTGVLLDKLEAYLRNLGDVNLVGKSFGVLKFRPTDGQITFDLSLPRTEVSTKVGGYKDFDVQYDPALSITDDLSRRDFTINAMAYDIINNDLIDPYNGQKDLRNKIIRTVEKPRDRFREDYSRILRGIRFACQHKMKIEPKTWQAMKDEMHHVFASNIVPPEIIGDEFLKAYAADPYKWFELAEESKLLPLILPEVNLAKKTKQDEAWHSEGNVYEHTKLVVSKLMPYHSLELKLGALFHDVGKVLTIKTPEKDGVSKIQYHEHTDVGGELTAKIAKRLRFPNSLKDYVVWLVENHHLFSSGSVYEMRPNTIYKYFIKDPDRGDDLLELYRLDSLGAVYDGQKKDLQNQKEVAVYVNKMRAAFAKAKTQSIRHLISGEDIMQEFGLESGPEVGKVLDKAEEYVLRYVTKNRKEPSKKKIIDYLRNR
ncbi:MAG: HD domain-containing protein [bacterium]